MLTLARIAATVTAFALPAQDPSTPIPADVVTDFARFDQCTPARQEELAKVVRTGFALPAHCRVRVLTCLVPSFDANERVAALTTRPVPLTVHNPGWPKPFKIEVSTLGLSIVWANPRRPAELVGVELRGF